MSDQTNNKSKLTTGTLAIIALIVLIFGNARVVSMDEKIEKMNEEIFQLRLQVGGLAKDNQELKELILKQNGVITSESTETQ